MANALYQELDRLKAENRRYAEAVLQMEKKAYYTDPWDGHEYCRFCNCCQSHAEPTHFDDCVVMLAVAMAHKETADNAKPASCSRGSRQVIR